MSVLADRNADHNTAPREEASRDPMGHAQERGRSPPTLQEAPARGERNAPQIKESETEKGAQSWRQRMRRHPWITGLTALAVIGVAIAAGIWWVNSWNYVSTDDAFIDAHWTQVSAQVSGAITQVAVTDNQLVAKGQVLLRIDDRTYQAAVDQAEANVAQAKASIANLDAQLEAQRARIDQAQKQVAEARAALQFAQQENQRYQNLLKRGAGTEQRAQQAAADLRQKQAAYNAAQANAAVAEKQIAVLQSQRQAAVAQLAQQRASLEQARTNLTRTTVTAPTAGRVTQLGAAPGTYAQPGQALMVLVPPVVWVTANFKETALSQLRVGQPVDIAVDAYGDRRFHGRVQSIQAGSGTAFSLLPPENATGNFVKVVQRVPVKIVFDKRPDVLLGPGMSVVATVTVQ